MDKYKPIEELISNENVVRVLNSSKLPGEGELLSEVVETGGERDVFNIYVTTKDRSCDDLIFLATVTKKKEKISNWYINFKGNFKERF